MKPALPELPKGWTLERHEDGSATVKAPGFALGTLSPVAISRSVVAFLFCMPLFLVVASFKLLQFCVGKEVWHFSASGMRIESKLFGFTWQTRRFADCTVGVVQEGREHWALRLHELQDDCTLYRSDRLPKVLALAAFLAEELGWREEQPDVVPPWFRSALDLAFAENDTTRLRLLLDDPRTPPVVLQAWLEAGQVQRIRIKSKLAAIEPECSWLTQGIEESTGGFRLLAIEIVGSLGEPRVLPALRRLLAGPPGEARTKAVVALGRMQDTEVVPALCEALRFEPGLWFAATEALGEIGDVRAVPDLSELLAALVRSREADLRRQIVVALGKIGDVSAIPTLADALDDLDTSVRLSAVEALGTLRRPEAAPPLLQALHDQDRQVAGKAAAALAALRDPRAVEPLTRALETAAPDRRIYVVKALAEIGSAEIVPVLCRSLEDPNAGVAREAALGLARIARTGSVVPVQVRAALPVLWRLSGAFSTETPEVKSVCWEAIRRIEAGTDSVKQLPLPSDPVSHAPEQLPLPARAEPESSAGDRISR